MEAEGITSSKDRLEEGVIDEDSKWYKLIDEFNAAIFRLVFLLQGLLSGMFSEYDILDPFLSVIN